MYGEIPTSASHLYSASFFTSINSSPSITQKPNTFCISLYSLYLRFSLLRKLSSASPDNSRATAVFRGYSISVRIATCHSPSLPPQALFQADKALVANDQVIDQLDVQALVRGD